MYYCYICLFHTTVETGYKNTGYKNTGYKNTGYKNILARNVSIRPSINFTFYKNIPVIRTFFSTPDDVLITGFHCIILTYTTLSGQRYLCHKWLITGTHIPLLIYLHNMTTRYSNL